MTKLSSWLRGGQPRYVADSSGVVRDFSRLYYELGHKGGTWTDTTWMGVRVWKNPLDLWVYQELLCELRPELIIETGTAFGGSALYLAHLCDLLGHGRVITIDVNDIEGRPVHGRIEYVRGSSVDPAIVRHVSDSIRGGDVVVAVLDSDHRRDHVRAELDAYAPLVSPGSYLVVEDTNIGHPVEPDFGPGPMDALDEFLATTDQFIIDPSREKFLFTFNPRGFLRRLDGTSRQ